MGVSYSVNEIKLSVKRAALFLFILTVSLIFFSKTCYANSVLEAQELKFEPVGGGKYIYCNNTEGIFRDSLADSSNPNPRYTMSNLNLTPDKYYIYLSHINYTYGYNEYYQPSGLGFDVELDLEITAKEDSVLQINRAAFETPKVQRYLDENNQVRYIYPTWGAENAVATMLGHDIYRLNSDIVFKNSGYTPKKITIKKGETVWLSQYVDNYAPCGMVLPVFMTADTELLSGKVDMNVVELKSKDGNVGDRSDFDGSKVAFGSYLRDRCHKGVADSLPEVEADLEYTIDDSIADGSYLPVSFTNRYAVDGITLDSWVTNLNPQDDIWSKYTTVETDMLPLKYYDPSKLTYYGKNIPQSERDDVWIFDTMHSDTKEYVSDSGVSQDNYSPNYELDITKDNHGIACSMGNYGVTERYNISITNNGSKVRYFNYDATTSANLVVTMRNADGSLTTEQEQPVISKGGSAWESSTTTCAYAVLPPHTTKNFILEVVLPVNYLGGTTNAFRISDTKPSFKLISSQKTMLGDYTTILNTYYDEYMNKADDETKALFSGNLDNFEVTETAYGYMLRFKEWDANPNSQGDFKTLASDIYFLNKDFSFVGKSHFDSFPMKAVFSDGKFIVKQMDGKRLFSIDGAGWQEAYWSESEDEKLDKILVNLNNEYLNFVDADPVLINDRTLVPMRLIFEKLGMTVMWDNLTQTAMAADENSRVSFTIGSDIASVNGKSFTMDTYPIMQNDRTLIPLRFLSESLGYRVSWNEIAKTVLIFDYPEFPAHNQKYYVIYREGYRDNRIEVAFFNVSNSSNPVLIWDNNISLADNNGVIQDDVKYYFDETADEWIQFESGYGAISNYAAAFIKSNLPAIFK